MSAWPAPVRLRLWTQLALFGAAGVVATFGLQLTLGRDVATEALEQETLVMGRDLARLVAHQVTDAVLVDDHFSVQESVQDAARSERVAWCFVERDGRVVASSFGAQTPPGLLALRSAGGDPNVPAVIINSGSGRYLQLVEPILGGAAGTVRVGMDMQPIQEARNRLGAVLSLVALLTMGVGVGAAFLVGRRVSQPIRALLDAADRFDPSVPALPVAVKGTTEFAELAVRFNQMMNRLALARQDYDRTLQKGAASERLAALGSLVAGVAHEVNNPLAGLKNCHAALVKGDLPPAKQREYLELMGDALGRIQDIVARLLDYGKPRPLALRPEALGEMARAAAALVRPVLRSRRVELVELDDGAGGFEVLADRRQIEQALLNLLLNALYVTPSGGRLRLRVHHHAGRGAISVEDDGPGIPVDLRSRVLDPFFSTKPEGEGTGLGLTVTRTIVDSHQGDLVLEFPERGTVATIWLPGAPRA